MWRSTIAGSVAVVAIATFIPAITAAQPTADQQEDALDAARRATRRQRQSPQPTPAGAQVTAPPAPDVFQTARQQARIAQCEQLLAAGGTDLTASTVDSATCPSPEDDILPTRRLRYSWEKWWIRIKFLTLEERALQRAQEIRANQLRCSVLNCAQIGNAGCAAQAYEDLTDVVAGVVQIVDDLSGGNSVTSQQVEQYLQCAMGVGVIIPSINEQTTQNLPAGLGQLRPSSSPQPLSPPSATSSRFQLQLPGTDSGLGNTSEIAAPSGRQPDQAFGSLFGGGSPAPAPTPSP